MFLSSISHCRNSNWTLTRRKQGSLALYSPFPLSLLLVADCLASWSSYCPPESLGVILDYPLHAVPHLFSKNLWIFSLIYAAVPLSVTIWVSVTVHPVASFLFPELLQLSFCYLHALQLIPNAAAHLVLQVHRTEEVTCCFSYFTGCLLLTVSLTDCIVFMSRVPDNHFSCLITIHSADLQAFAYVGPSPSGTLSPCHSSRLLLWFQTATKDSLFQMTFHYSLVPWTIFVGLVCFTSLINLTHEALKVKY